VGCVWVCVCACVRVCVSECVLCAGVRVWACVRVFGCVCECVRGGSGLRTATLKFKAVQDQDPVPI
jgi:hypothetical protein